jgi:hypothetical protein
MDARTRTTVEMSKRVLAFFETHKDQVPADLPPLTRLKEIVARTDQLFTQQRNGIKEVRAATGEKRDMRRKIRRTHLPNFTRVAEAAAEERPELASKLELPIEALPYLAFRAAVQGILSESQEQLELLTRYGLVDSAPKSLADALAQFDRAVERGVSGRQAHVGARAELAALADEIIQKVRQLDGFVRYRFADDAEAFAAWRSASNTFGPPRVAQKNVETGGPSAGGPSTPPPAQAGEHKPAA